MNTPSAAPTDPAALPEVHSVLAGIAHARLAQMNADSLHPLAGPLASSAHDARTVQFQGQTLIVRVSRGHAQWRNPGYAIDLYTLNGLPYATITILIYLRQGAPLKEDEAVIDNEGLNSGVLQALVEAGVVEPTDRRLYYLTQTYVVCRVLPEPERPGTD